jgi:hypothetical protein
MKSLIIILLSILLGQNLKANDELFSISNPQRSEFIRSEIFNKFKINSDEVILLLVSPNTAPRLEFLIKLTLENLAKVKVKPPYYTLVAYPRLYALEKYARSKSYNKNMILDTSMILFDQYHLRNVPPVLTRWSKNGELLNYFFIYGINLNEVDWNSFLNKRKKIDESRSAVDNISNGYTKNDFKDKSSLEVRHELLLQENENRPYGLFGGVVVDENNKYLVMTDYLSLETLIFDLSNGQEVDKLELDYEQRKIFSKELSDELFQSGEKRGIAATLFFKSFFDKDDNLYVTATLPQVVLTIDGLDSTIFYNNISCLVKYSLGQSGVSFKKIIKFNYDTYSNLVMHHAIPGEFNQQNNEIAIPVMKGYPVSGFSKEGRLDEENPIKNKFYENAPLFCTYNVSTGNKVALIGKLSTINKKIGSGYYFANAQITYNNSNYFLSQHLVPYLQISDGSILKLKSYFNKDLVNELQNRILDTIPSTSDMDIIYENSDAAITSISANDKQLSVIWKIKESGKQIKDSEIEILQMYSLKNKDLIGEYLIPTSDSNLKLVSEYHNQKKNTLVCVYQNAMKTKIVFYKL